MVSRWACSLLVVAALAAGCGRDRQEGEATNLGEGEERTSTSANATSTSVAGTEGACEIQGGVGTTGDEVTVGLTEWAVGPSVARVAAGIVSFLGENAGKEDHELVIVKGDSAAALPKDADGAMDEAQLPEGALVGEIEPFASGQLCRGNFALQKGNYVLLCNVVEQEDSGVTESHFAEGMHAPFTVDS